MSASPFSTCQLSLCGAWPTMVFSRSLASLFVNCLSPPPEGRPLESLSVFSIGSALTGRVCHTFLLNGFIDLLNE